MVRREEEALSRKKWLVICRYALILFSGFLGFLEAREGFPIAAVILVGLGAFSNVYVGMLDPFDFFDNTVESTILVMDTAMVFMILLVSGSTQTLTISFFVVLLAAALIENLLMLAAAALVLGLLSLFIAQTGSGAVGAVVRVLFMMATAIFYGYIVLPEREQQRQQELQRGPEDQAYTIPPPEQGA